jgi:GWxTD domain-containing protein
MGCLFCKNSMAQTESIMANLDVKLSIVKDSVDRATQYNPMFIDTAISTLYFSLTTTARELHSTKVYIELKKKSKLASYLKPIWEKTIQLETKSLPNTDSININATMTESGNYILKFYWIRDGEKVLANDQVLQILRSKQMPIKHEPIIEESASNEIDLSKTFVSKYSALQLQRNIAALAPIAQGAELRMVMTEAKNVELIYMKQFFYNFWLSRDYKNPEKMWTEYASKLNDVSKKYGTGTTPGYRTDRGRIYLKYGVPDKLERVPNEKEAFPYEVWYYYEALGRGNVKFLFAQPGLMNNEMFLIHSNQEDEIVNQMWEYNLLTNPNDADKKLKHRVYEYFNQ